MPSRSPSSSDVGAVERLLAEGVELHRAGRSTDAAARYQEVLREAPEHPGALHLLGVVALQEGDASRAVQLIDRAIAARPGQAAYFNNRGNALRALNRHEEAVQAYRAALELQPDLVDALSNVGATLRHLGRLQEARGALERALARAPGNTSVLNNLANVLDELGDHAGALDLWRKAVAFQPRHAESWRNMGRALLREGEREEALRCLREAATIDPGNADTQLQFAHAQREIGNLDEAEVCYRKACELAATSENLNALGVVLMDRKQFDEAESALVRAAAADPASGTPIANLGTIALNRAEYEVALERYRQAIAIDPRTHAGYNGQGVVLAILGDFKGALACFDRELANHPNDAEARMNRGITLLTLGQFRDAWADYEHRLRRSIINKASGPRWQGESLEGTTLLVFPEQGAGDNIQFLRYLALVRRRYAHARIVHPVQKPLRRLFADYLARLSIEMPEGEEVQIHGYQISLMSLPALFGTTLATIPNDVPYLAAPREAAERWSAELAGRPGRKVGLVWGGNPDYAMDRERSVPFAALAPLFAVPGVQWVNLQKGRYAADAERLLAEGSMLDLVAQADDFLDTAALIEALDLVISVDTSIAHLAGAMAKPVWLLNRANTDWRWLTARADSPWYPTMRIFRQPRRGDWAAAVAEAARALAEH